MTYIVEKVINFNDDFSGRASSYIDDIFVPTNLISAQDVKNHFEEYGLMCKEPQHLSHNSVRVLGLKVEGDWSWSRDKPLPDIQNGKLTRREAHGIVGKWIGHFPVAGWLRIVAAFVQRLTAEAGTKWDDAVDNGVKAILVECHNRLTQKGDPVCGYWPVHSGTTLHVWTDSSSIGMGVVRESDGRIIEDASWLKSSND